MESILYDSIIDFVRPQLSNYQHGFLFITSSVQQLLACYHENIHQGLGMWQGLGYGFLGLKKSFDSVPHNDLLSELWHVGFTGKLRKQFCACLRATVSTIYVDYEIIFHQTGSQIWNTYKGIVF